jgi:hypothetical protein
MMDTRTTRGDMMFDQILMPLLQHLDAKAQDIKADVKESHRDFIAATNEQTRVLRAILMELRKLNGDD